MSRPTTPALRDPTADPRVGSPWRRHSVAAPGPDWHPWIKAHPDLGEHAGPSRRSPPRAGTRRAPGPAQHGTGHSAYATRNDEARPLACGTGPVSGCGTATDRRGKRRPSNPGHGWRTCLRRPLDMHRLHRRRRLTTAPVPAPAPRNSHGHCRRRRQGQPCPTMRDSHTTSGPTPRGASVSGVPGMAWALGERPSGRVAVSLPFPGRQPGEDGVEDGQCDHPGGGVDRDPVELVADEQEQESDHPWVGPQLAA